MTPRRDRPGALADVSIGHHAVIADSRRVDAAQRRRLAELGLRPGAEVQVLMRTAGGGRLLAIDDARVVVGREILGQIGVGHPAGPELG